MIFVRSLVHTSKKAVLRFNLFINALISRPKNFKTKNFDISTQYFLQ